MFQKYDKTALNASLSVSADMCHCLNMVDLSLTGQLCFEFNSVFCPNSLNVCATLKPILINLNCVIHTLQLKSSLKSNIVDFP